MKENLQTLLDWLAIGTSLLWLAGVSLLFSNSALTAGWLLDAVALVVFGLVTIWGLWWLLRGLVSR